MYKYSVIIPAYNCEKTIGRAVNSVLCQTYSNWELIIIDDGSTDGTADTIRSIMDNRISLFIQENSGPGQARNNGLKHATGDYIVFLDADDYYESDYLDSIEKVNAADKRDVVFVDFINEREDGTRIETSHIYKFKDNSKNELISKQMTGILPWGPVVKAVAIEIARQCEFSTFAVGEESIYSFDVLFKSRKIGFVEQPKYHYVYNDNGQHKRGGLDPWGGVVASLSEHIKRLGCYEQYQKSLNSFAIRALCINVYRCACAYPKKQAVEEIEKAYVEYRNAYDLNSIEHSLLDKKSEIIICCLKMKMFWLVYVASRLRENSL